MRNYDKLVQYASTFVGGGLAKDLVHDIWLRFYNQGVDILSVDKSNRFLYVTVKNEFLNSKKFKNAGVRIGYSELEDHVSVYEPTFSMDYDIMDNSIRNRIECEISKRNDVIIGFKGRKTTRPYNASKLLETYNLLLLECSTKEISEFIEVPEPTVRNYIKKIKDLSSFTKLSIN